MSIRLILASPRSGVLRRRMVPIALALMVGFLLSACSGGTSPSPDGGAGSTSVNPSSPTAEASPLVGTIELSSTPTTQAGSPPGPVSFSKDVLPILQSRCFNCHGGQRTEKGLDMTGYSSLMTGSQNGAVVEPGNPDNSSMIQLIQQGKMPKRGPKLLPDQVQLLVDWIKAGAPNN